MRKASAREGFLALVASAAVITTAAFGLIAAPPSEADDAAPNANAMLDKLAHAESAKYHARQLVVYFGHPQSAAMLDVRSTGSGEFVRAESGADVTKIWRGDGVGIVAQAGTNLEEADVPSVPIDPAEIVAKYDIEAGPPQELLGVAVVPLTLRRRDDGRLTERWLVHEKSGIVYQRGLYDANEKLVAMSTIIDMKWGAPGASERFDPTSGSPTRVRAIDAKDAPKRLAEGYRLLHAYGLRAGGRPAEHWVYSDGLHALSVFRTKGRLRAPSGFEKASLGKVGGWSGPGPGTWAWEGGGHSFVLVAEEPALDAVRMLRPFPKGGPSVLARMGSVWASIGHAVGRLIP